MLFNSFQFLVFYVAVVPVVFAIPHRYQWALLLAASYYFYMCWNPVYILVIWGITIIDFSVGIRLEQSQDCQRRKMWLLLSLLANFGILLVFKYTDFFVRSLQSILLPFHILGQVPQLGWLLPVGISFHTFQAVSYTLDVYRGRVPAERHLGHYALYVAFFPQMVAGPIERPGSLLPQIPERKRLEYTRLRSGLELILWGLWKKLIVADSLAVIVNRVFGSPREFGGPLLVLAAVSFAIQIYADFSGYSDMAVGLARILGYDLTINFRQPYFATSIAEYWRRWHISLSSWFRDYVYLPLGGNRRSPAHWAFAVMLVFVLSGLWHGAGWTFAAWGALHGIYLVLGRLLKPAREAFAAWSGITRLPRTRRLLQCGITFALLTGAFILFRARSAADVYYIATHWFRIAPFRPLDLLTAGLPPFELLVVALAAAVMFGVEFLQVHPRPTLLRYWEARRLRWPLYAACFYCLVFFGVFERVEFIYFQF